MLRRYTFIRQTEPGDGTAAALAMVCLHHGIAVELAQIPSINGASLPLIVRAAEALGLAGRVVKSNYDPLTQLPLPALAQVRTASGQEQLLVVHRADAAAVVVADPAQDRIQTLSRDDFCRLWTGRVVVLVPESVLRSLEVSQPTAPLWRLATLFLGRWLLLLEALLCSLFIALLGLAAAHALRQLIDWSSGNGATIVLRAVVLCLVLIVVCRVTFALVRDYLLYHLGQRLDALFGMRYVHHLVRLPLSFFDTHPAGDLVARLLDTSKLRTLLSHGVTGLVLDLVSVVVGLVVLWFVHVPTALIALLGAAGMLLLLAVAHPFGRARAARAGVEQGHLATCLLENVTGAETLKGTAAERARADLCEGHLLQWLHDNAGLERLQLSLRTLSNLGLTLILLLVLWVSAESTLGLLAFCVLVTWLALEPLRRLALSQTIWQQGLAALGRLDAVLATATETTLSGRKIPFQELQQGIALDNVTFSYGPRGKVLEGVTLTIPAGRTIACVGSSGAGKSTLLRLLLGCYPVSEGQIKVDGVDLRDLDLDALREQMGLIDQEAALVHGTIAANVALGHPEAGLAEITAALRGAGLEEFVNRLPQRHETLLSERGSNLSAGQRQQLAIARALLRQPRILLLDEATSHLDAATERLVLDAVRWSLPGRTLVLVSQRLSAVMNADWIYVFHQGRVLEAGPHPHLLALNGHYAALWRAQFDPNDPAQQNSLAAAVVAPVLRPATAGSSPR